MNRAAALAARAAFAFALLLGTASATRADVAVPTQHNDNFRTGANLAETKLTPASVRGLERFDRAVDGVINTQILYAPGVMVGRTRRNVAYVATSANTVYAYDADDRSKNLRAGLLWETTLTDPAHPAGSYARGIGATPVLEILPGGKGTIDVLYSTADGYPLPFAVFVQDELALRSKLHVHFFLVKLDLATGKPVVPLPPAQPAELRGSMLRNDNVTMTFDAKNANDVASLLLDHGYLYVSFSARQNENVSEYYGWILRYNAKDLTYAGAVNTAPHSWNWVLPGNPEYHAGTIACYAPSGGRLKPWDTAWVNNGGASTMACVGEGGGIWQGGAGPAADRAGNVYAMIGNGHYDPAEGSYGDSIVRLHSLPGGGTTAADFGVDHSWAPAEYSDDEVFDVDLGSAGPMVVDGNPSASAMHSYPERVLVGGKTGIFYVVDDTASTSVQSIFAGVDQRQPHAPGADDLRYRTWDRGPHLHGSPTLWRVSGRKAYVYEWAEKDYLKKYEFDLAGGRFTRPRAVGQEKDVLAAPCLPAPIPCLNAMPGGVLALSAHGRDENSGIVWAILRAPALLSTDKIYAFDARTLKLLWSDSIGAVPHFAGPTVADGHVFVPTNSMQMRFTIYSLGHGAPPRAARPAAALPHGLADIAKAKAMPMGAGAAKSPIPDYANDPAFLARLELPVLMRAVPPHWYVAAAYAVLGNEVLCTTAGECPRTEITHVYPFDDRPPFITGPEIPLANPCLYSAAALKATTTLDRSFAPTSASSSMFPAWQVLAAPSCPVFPQGSYLVRAWPVYVGSPAPGTPSIPFAAVYLQYQPEPPAG